ncbi:unnamed protein product [marine sediment metagenome]|uniref:YvrJ family protein n=1 Tax=marine sediment metagenome TaxID=412755 RepID=X1AK09_9ZZZZ
MAYEEVANLISNVGFPIAITLYLLISQNKIIGQNTKAVNELTILKSLIYGHREPRRLSCHYLDGISPLV